MTRAVVIKYGEPVIADAIADGMGKAMRLSREELAIVKAENEHLKAQKGVADFAQDKEWPNTQARLAQAYTPKRHGKLYNAILLWWALSWAVIFAWAAYLQDWNREP